MSFFHPFFKFGISGNQFLFTDSVFAAYAKDCFFAFYFMHFFASGNHRTLNITLLSRFLGGNDLFLLLLRDKNYLSDTEILSAQSRIRFTYILSRYIVHCCQFIQCLSGLNCMECFSFLAFFSFGNFWSTEDITVPDVTGKQVEIAKKILKDKKLDVSVKEVESDEVPVGEVISQTPSGGAVVKANRTIYLTVSKGNKGEEVLIPDLRSLTLDEAEKKLKEIGLSVGKVRYKESAQYADGTIIDQDPESPKKVEKGTKVDLVVCRKSEAEKEAEAAKNEAPNTSGMSLDAAVKALESAGYSIGSVSNLDSSKDSSQAVVTGQTSEDGKVVNLSVEYPSSQSSQSSPSSSSGGSDGSANNQEPAGTPHYGTVNISVPSGASSQHVQIVVSDDNGSRVVYDRSQAGGANISKSVSGTGKTRVKVYINNSLVQDQYI